MNRPSRNDPCPCGSGRKYKACCMARDRAAEHTLRVVGTGARAGDPSHLAARRAACWEADVVPVQLALRDEPDTSPALAIVGAAGLIVHGGVVERPVGLAARARAVADAVLAAARAVGVYPETLHVRDGALAQALSPELAPRGVAVSAEPMPELDEAIHGSLAHLMGSETSATMTAVDTWAETEATPGELAALHEAAAAFYRCAPWHDLENEDVVELAYPDGGELWASVMGAGGMSFGLALFSRREDLEELYTSDDPPERTIARLEGWSLNASFEPRSELRRRMRREFDAAGWEVAGPDAYLRAWAIHLPEHRITAGHVRRVTSAMRAIVRAMEIERGEDEVSFPDEGMQVNIERDRPPSPFTPLRAAHPIGPEGPNADPEAPLRVYDGGYQVAERAELERVARFEAWLQSQPLSKAAIRRHLRNGRHWALYLAGMAVTTPGATEYDLRDYLYEWMPRKERLPRDVKKVLPASLALWCAWLEANEGVSYPWARAVLDEYPRVAEARGPAPRDGWWAPAVAEWRSVFADDVQERVMRPDEELPGTRAGWPPVMSPAVARLRHELERRWLIWYDEAVRMGTTDLDVLWEVLAGRQRGWENTPSPALDGRTPRQVVAAFEEEALARGGFPVDGSSAVRSSMIDRFASLSDDDGDEEEDDDGWDDEELDGLFGGDGEHGDDTTGEVAS